LSDISKIVKTELYLHTLKTDKKSFMIHRMLSSQSER